MNAELRKGSATELGFVLGPEYRTAWPESELVSKATGEVVGFIYIWCNGERSPFWLDQPVDDALEIALQNPS